MCTDVARILVSYHIDDFSHTIFIFVANAFLPSKRHPSNLGPAPQFAILVLLVPLLSVVRHLSNLLYFPSSLGFTVALPVICSIDDRPIGPYPYGRCKLW